MRILLGVFLLSELVLIVQLARSKALGRIPFALGLAALTLVVSLRWPWGALMTLVAASAVSHFSIEVNGWNARPEHIVAGFVLSLWLAGLPLRKRQTINATVLDYAAAGYVLVNYISSIFMSPEPSLSLRWALLNNLAVLQYFLVRFLGTGRQYVRRVFDYLLVAGVLAAAYGICCFLLNRMFGTAVGVESDKYVDIPGPYGTLYDSNVFGNYTGCCAVMLLALWLFGDGQHRRHYIMGFLLTAVATTVSLARSVLLAFLLVFFFLLYLAVQRGVLLRRKILSLFAQTIVLLLIVLPWVGSFIGTRLGTLGAQDSSVYGRVIEDLAAVGHIKEHPLLGNGTMSFSLLFRIEEYVPALAGNPFSGIENTFLRILHDTGAIGLAIFLTLVTSLALRTRRVILASSSEQYPLLVALTAAVLVDAIAFQFTDAGLLSFGWIHLGLLVSLVLLLEREQATGKVAAELQSLKPSPTTT